MRKAFSFMAMAALAFGLGAQPLRVATMEQTAFYGPVILAALKEAGVDATIVTMPQDQMIQELGKGSIDGAFFLPEPLIGQAKGSVRVPVRISSTDFCALTVDEGVKIANPGDLRKYAVGIVKGNQAHQAMTRGMKPLVAENDLEQYKLLASGTAQAIIVVDKAVPGLAGAAGIKKYSIQTPPLLKSPMYFAFSKAHGSKKDAAEAVFKKWIENGKWEKEISAVEAKMKGAKR